ncbi:SIS domain-containing protein [Salmonella enterica]|uniref:SIS domain-containing protein n=1 Tax=Salmonella enterica TaxID=28901 RepID=UPI0028E81116|nr:SIS domain-containing protein [Salmonella enterica]
MSLIKEDIADFLTIVNEELYKFEEAIDYTSLSKACALILDAEEKNCRVHITGIGKPGHVSAYAASLFSSIGVPTYFLDGTEAIHGSSGQVVEGDIVIAISNSGETHELLQTIECLLDNGAKIISLTGNMNSPLAKRSQISLTASADNEGDSLNKPPRASILVEILTLQMLSILLQNEKQLTAEQYVKWHPGGKIGNSILGGSGS